MRSTLATVLACFFFEIVSKERWTVDCRISVPILSGLLPRWETSCCLCFPKTLSPQNLGEDFMSHATTLTSKPIVMRWQRWSVDCYWSIPNQRLMPCFLLTCGNTAKLLGFSDCLWNTFVEILSWRPMLPMCWLMLLIFLLPGRKWRDRSRLCLSWWYKGCQGQQRQPAAFY